MLDHKKTVGDPFAFSRGGVTTIASIMAPPAIDSSRLNRLPGERKTQLRGMPLIEKARRLVRRRRRMHRDCARVT